MSRQRLLKRQEIQSPKDYQQREEQARPHAGRGYIGLEPTRQTDESAIVVEMVVQHGTRRVYKHRR